MMQLIRSNAGKFLVFPLMLGFLLWMVFEIGMQVTGAGNSRPGELGSVNGTVISAQMYQQAYDQNYQQALENSGGKLPPEQSRAIREQTWNELVNDIIMQQELARRGITATDEEIRYAARNIPHPALAQREIFQTDGRFDLKKYQAFLTGPTVDDQTLLFLEQYYRNVIPRMKLQRQLAAGMYVTDAELWRAWQDRSETATVEYVPLELAKLAPGEVSVSDAEVTKYYQEHKDEFKRPETARFTVAYLDKTVTDADRAAALAKARELRQEIVNGADFAEVARRESSDQGSAEKGGELGTFGRGQMVPAFEQAAFSLPIGEVSEPVQSQFGYHLIQVEKRDSATVTARHILIPIEKSDAQLQKLDAKADSLQKLAATRGIDRAARLVGASLLQGVPVTEDASYIPGVGSGAEALEWAEGEARSKEEADSVSDVMETDQALYVVKLESFAQKGTMTEKEAAPQIRRDLIREKKRAAATAAGRKLLAEVRAGKPLAEVAKEHGLPVDTVGPFTRVQPNPVFGQANAAVGAAFGVPIGQVSDVVETPAGLFLIRPLQRTQADRKEWEAQKAEQRAAVTGQLQQDVLSRWIESARQKAKIEDNRDEVFGKNS